MKTAPSDAGKREEKPAAGKQSRRAEEKDAGKSEEKRLEETPEPPAGAQSPGGDPSKQEVVDFVSGEDRFLARKLAQAHLLEVSGDRVTIKFLKNGINHEKELKKPGKLRGILRKMLGVERVRLDIGTIDDEGINGTGGNSRKPDPAEDEIVNYAIRQFDASVIRRKNLTQE